MTDLQVIWREVGDGVARVQRRGRDWSVCVEDCAGECVVIDCRSQDDALALYYAIAAHSDGIW